MGWCVVQGVRACEGHLFHIVCSPYWARGVRAQCAGQSVEHINCHGTGQKVDQAPWNGETGRKCVWYKQSVSKSMYEIRPELNPTCAVVRAPSKNSRPLGTPFPLSSTAPVVDQALCLTRETQGVGVSCAAS